ncbi:hypothetical protein [Mycolicibacter arupensis]|jgi:hypothetical protein|uniref:Uncharacterized protein n=1 Tax=Mycolicibacter arupensis TaxID=342002 RepID=A0A0F5MXY6_9MYCO|nr:hypothetical protein [Mycolicibacter arupensis]KKB99459.1 hypothetical protein WR43_09570 [Mycolicibacter arupensis]MCV7277066.1 hypothetical protein [Mycolicibacter arupensis]OQZ91199.1 hypothetical protein BST15_20255 [Mycolicibacter arupensis]TXI54463.1 MAG: hypothetical protein E6Q54_14785 [Mycolicibacter arupensis]
MPDFTAVFTQERDHWQARAEAAESSLAQLKVEMEALVARNLRQADTITRVKYAADRIGGAAGRAICQAIAVRGGDRWARTES